MSTKAQSNYKAEADRIADERGGLCLSSEIPTKRFRAFWKCANPKHPTWPAKFESVKGWSGKPGNWCRRCYAERKAQMRLHSTEYVSAKLAEKQILLLSNYNGIEEKIDCRCLRCGYEWTTRYRHITRGHGCPECGDRRIAEMRRRPEQEIVSVLMARRITVLAIHREKPRTRVAFRCDNCGFEDTGWWNDLRRRGCPECGRKRRGIARRLTFDSVKQYLAERGIQLLSKDYAGNRAKLHVRFECGCEGHVKFNSIQNGNRCSKCAPNARVALADYRELAAFYEGQLLEAAATVKQPAKWKCCKGHDFSRPYSNIQQSGTFCPICSEGLSERICRAAAEQLFGTPFLKTKLRKVRGVGGRYLELDAYSESLKLAIEHNGPQHYRPVRFGNQTEEQAAKCFCKQQEHDRRRREFCRVNGITLIEVPTLGGLTRTEELKDFIGVECQKANFALPEGFDRVKLELDAHHLATTAEEMWERVLKRVGELGYTLRTSNYPGANERLILTCHNGHDYTPKLASFLRGAKCQRCLIQQRAVSVVALPLGMKAEVGCYRYARVFDTIQECSKALKASPNSVRMVAKGRGNSCMGFGVAQVSQAQAKCFRENRKSLIDFCRSKWPSPETYDKQDGSRKRLSKAVVLSDGRSYPSKAAAARALGVTKATIAYAVRSGRKCYGVTVKLASSAFH